MRHVIIRDDDTNAHTPVECLERLYRPFLDRGLPVNLATIPSVTGRAQMADGSPEGFLPSEAGLLPAYTAIGENQELVRYLLDNPGFEIVQHGCHHDYLEFDTRVRDEVSHRLDLGAKLLREAGFPKPMTFVAPYDRISKESLREIAARFPVVSTGWFELKRLPFSWWPRYVLKKARHAAHWSVGRTVLLSHPGCLLSCHRSYSAMLGGILETVNSSRLTVLVTHWWEYFRDGKQNQEFIDFLHETASYLATHPEIKVIRFSDLLKKNIPLG
jgi:predicted deacetylase